MTYPVGATVSTSPFAAMYCGTVSHAGRRRGSDRRRTVVQQVQTGNRVQLDRRLPSAGALLCARRSSCNKCSSATMVAVRTAIFR